MKLFLSVWYEGYKNDVKAIKKKGDLIDPDSLQLEQMRQFFRQRIWRNGDEDWDAWIVKIQQRRNAVHTYKSRDIGTFDEFSADVRRYFKFLQYINGRLPYPW
jgi:transposase